MEVVTLIFKDYINLNFMVGFAFGVGITLFFIYKFIKWQKEDLRADLERKNKELEYKEKQLQNKDKEIQNKDKEMQNIKEYYVKEDIKMRQEKKEFEINVGKIIEQNREPLIKEIRRLENELIGLRNQVYKA